jgi:hypothetical protein
MSRRGSVSGFRVALTDTICLRRLMVATTTVARVRGADTIAIADIRAGAQRRIAGRPARGVPR